MTDVLRSINITHRKATNLQFRVGVHVPHQIDDKNDPKAVVEIHVRNQSGITEMAASLELAEFVDLARDIASVGKSVLPKQDDEPAV